MVTSCARTQFRIFSTRTLMVTQAIHFAGAIHSFGQTRVNVKQAMKWPSRRSDRILLKHNCLQKLLREISASVMFSSGISAYHFGQQIQEALPNPPLVILSAEWRVP